MNLHLGSVFALWIWLPGALFVLAYGIFIGSARRYSDKAIALILILIFIGVVTYLLAGVN